jgi:hypothetical protein
MGRPCGSVAGPTRLRPRAARPRCGLPPSAPSPLGSIGDRTPSFNDTGPGRGALPEHLAACGKAGPRRMAPGRGGRAGGGGACARSGGGSLPAPGERRAALQVGKRSLDTGMGRPARARDAGRVGPPHGGAMLVGPCPPTRLRPARRAAAPARPVPGPAAPMVPPSRWLGFAWLQDGRRISRYPPLRLRGGLVRGPVRRPAGAPPSRGSSARAGAGRHEASLEGRSAVLGQPGYPGFKLDPASNPGYGIEPGVAPSP